MPEISRFYGIIIKMYFDEHLPPHFHAEYGEYEGLVNINTLGLFSGRLPPRALGLNEKWNGSRECRIDGIGNLSIRAFVSSAEDGRSKSNCCAIRHCYGPVFLTHPPKEVLVHGKTENRRLRL